MALLSVVASVVLTTVMRQSVPGITATALEYEVKAAYILNFVNFIEWPAASLGAPADPFRICIAGRDPFGGALEKTVLGETVAGHPIVVESPAPEDIARRCHVLFVPGKTPRAPVALLRTVESTAVLTIGESDAFLRSGGIMSFSTDQGHVRFDVDRHNAERRGLTLSSRLLRVARSVR